MYNAVIGALEGITLEGRQFVLEFGRDVLENGRSKVDGRFSDMWPLVSGLWEKKEHRELVGNFVMQFTTRE